LQAEGLQQK